MRRLLRRALLIYLVASLAAGIVLGEFALQRGRWPGRGGADARAQAVAAAYHARLVPAHLVAADGIALEGWLFTRDDGPARPTVLVAHGFLRLARSRHGLRRVPAAGRVRRARSRCARPR